MSFEFAKILAIILEATAAVETPVLRKKSLGSPDSFFSNQIDRDRFQRIVDIAMPILSDGC